VCVRVRAYILYLLWSYFFSVLLVMWLLWICTWSSLFGRANCVSIYNFSKGFQVDNNEVINWIEVKIRSLKPSLKPTKQKEIMLIPRHELYGNLRLHETLNSAVFQLSVWLLVTLIAYNDWILQVTQILGSLFDWLRIVNWLMLGLGCPTREKKIRRFLSTYSASLHSYP